MKNKATKNVWEFLGLDEKKSKEFELRIMIHEKIMEEVEKRKLSARDLEKVLDERQPRVSDLLNTKLAKFSSDKLYSYLTQLCPASGFKLTAY